MVAEGVSAFDLKRNLVKQTRHLPLELSRPVRYMCAACNTADESHQTIKLLRCKNCKAVCYCNKVCQLKDWKQGGDVSAPYKHKQCCRDYANDMKEFQEDPNGVLVRTDVFPWANHHTSGAFFTSEFLVRRGLYGKKGFWAVPDTLRTHSSGDDPQGWCHGEILLQKYLPSIKKGWVSLAESEIPSGPCLQNPVASWAEYAEHRNLSSSSIAPLLLTNVLTIYHMIVHEFKFHLRKPKNDKHYVIYVLGAERELNSLPLLEELAYLLPGIDVEL